MPNPNLLDFNNAVDTIKHTLEPLSTRAPGGPDFSDNNPLFNPEIVMPNYPKDFNGYNVGNIPTSTPSIYNKVNSMIVLNTSDSLTSIPNTSNTSNTSNTLNTLTPIPNINVTPIQNINVTPIPNTSNFWQKNIIIIIVSSIVLLILLIYLLFK